MDAGVLNLDTLLLVQVCVAVLTTLLLVASACYTESPPEQRWWASGNVVVTLGMGLSNVQTLPLLLTGVLSYGVIAFGLALVLRGGEVVEQGAVERVLGEPRHPYTRDLLAALA